MANQASRGSGSDRSVVAFILSLVVLATPAVQWWAGSGSTWWQVFALWGTLIAVIGWANAGRDRDS